MQGRRLPDPCPREGKKAFFVGYGLGLVGGLFLGRNCLFENVIKKKKGSLHSGQSERRASRKLVATPLAH